MEQGVPGRNNGGGCRRPPRPPRHHPRDERRELQAPRSPRQQGQAKARPTGKLRHREKHQGLIRHHQLGAAATTLSRPAGIAAAGRFISTRWTQQQNRCRPATIKTRNRLQSPPRDEIILSPLPPGIFILIDARLSPRLSRHILWVVGVTGYFLLVVEAIIGASLWAFAHLRMDGEGISGNAVNGWTLLLSLLLTPVLMVFGFIVGMAIFRVTSTLLMSGLLPTFYSATAGTNMMTMLMLIPVMMLALGVMQLLLIERSFSMITELPNRVLSWIGGKADLMDQHAADRARVGMIATTAASGTIGGAAAKAVGSRVQRGWSRLRDRRAGTGGASQSDDRPTDS